MNAYDSYTKSQVEHMAQLEGLEWASFEEFLVVVTPHANLGYQALVYKTNGTFADNGEAIYSLFGFSDKASTNAKKALCDMLCELA